MKTYTAEELKEILELHKKWLNDEECCVKANLGGANLIGAYLRGANLREAYLVEADLGGANLVEADLGGANLGGANLIGAYLRGADLRGADLGEANLRGADLRGAMGDMNFIKSLQCEKYLISYTATFLNIGCQSHTIEEWKNFDDVTISKMDSGALEWWAKWKPIIMQIIEMSPAEDTGYVEKTDDNL